MKVLVVIPAFNAAHTLEDTWNEIPDAFREHVLLADDGSSDETGRVARTLGIDVLAHPRNRGYGASQKTLYAEAMRRGADAVVMLHADFQYEGTAIPLMLEPIEAGYADVVLGSRILEQDPRDSGMPGWRYYGNRFLTTCENRTLGMHLTDYHTGLRSFRIAALETLQFQKNSDDFLFDQQILVQAVVAGLRVVEVPAGCRYFEGASSISFRRSVQYGLGTLKVLAEFSLHSRSARAADYLSPRPASSDP